MPRSVTLVAGEKLQREGTNRRVRAERLLGIRENQPIGFDLDALRPRTRGECRDQPRPCPWAGCRHHLYLEVNPESGSIKLVFPTKELHELDETCSLDVAERGPSTLEAIGEVTNLTRERARQIELQALHQPQLAELRKELAA